MSQHLIVDMAHVREARKMARPGDTISFYAGPRTEKPAYYEVVRMGTKTGLLSRDGPPSEAFEEATNRVAERIEKWFADPDAVDTKRVVNEGLRALGADEKWVNNVSDDGRYESTSTGTSTSI